MGRGKQHNRKPWMFLLIIVLAAILIMVWYFIGTGVIGIQLAGFPELPTVKVRFDLLSTYTGVEAKLVTRSQAGFQERAIEGAGGVRRYIDFTLYEGEKIKYIEWNSDQRAGQTVWLEYVVSGDVVIDIDKNKIPVECFSDTDCQEPDEWSVCVEGEQTRKAYSCNIEEYKCVSRIESQECTVCTPGERRCLDNIIQLCSEDGKRWETSLLCPYGCDNEEITCNIAPAYCGDGMCNNNETATSCPSDCEAAVTPPPEDYTYLPWIAIAIVVAIAFTYFFAIRRRKPSKNLRNY